MVTENALIYELFEKRSKRHVGNFPSEISRRKFPMSEISRDGTEYPGTLAGRGRGRLLRIRERVFLQRAVAVVQGSERRRGRVRAHRGDGSLGHGRFGDSSEEARQESPGSGAPPSMCRLCAVCQTLGCQACTYRRTALRAPRCREPWPGSDPMKTVGAQFSVLRRTCSVSELCIISLHANK